MKDLLIQEGFPTRITPGSDRLNRQAFLESLPTYRDQIQSLLLQQGALLFRGFPVQTADDFTDVITALGLGQFVDYTLGDSPRDKVAKKIYTSTEVPSGIHLPLHQELSYIKRFPSHIYFFCETAPAFGGETIIADARRVYEALSPDVIARFNEKHICYISRYFHKSPILSFINRFARSHKSWPEVFETTEKSQVETLCEANEVQFKWLKNDWIEIRQILPACTMHPVTGESIWFNQAHLYDFNFKLLGPLNYLGTKLLYWKKSTRLHEVRYGDGSKIERQGLYHILDVLNQHTVAFPWQRGDVMVLDNVLAMHGRAPFKGKRRILTALTQP